MAKWTQLPKELVDEIANHLDTQFDNLRFRSVCSFWRSSVPAKPRRFPSRFPILPNDGISDTTWGFYLFRRTIFLIGPPEPWNQAGHPDGWLVKVEEDSRRKTHLFNPLSRSRLGPLPENFPRTFDLSGFRVLELGQEYVLQYINYRPLANSLTDAGSLYMEKVVFMCSGLEGHDFVLLTIHVSGKLALFRSGDKRWSIIQEMPSPYDDVVLYKGKFYAVDSTGRTVLVGVSASLSMVAVSVFGGDKKFLVESKGGLLLVDMYLSIDAEGDPDISTDEAFEQLGYCMSERTVRFRVFSLDEKGQKWDEVTDLGDRVLFLGDDCTFSASATDICGLKGNCIFFTDNYFHLSREGEGQFRGLDIGVFDLDSGSIEPIENYPGYSRLFWPPPNWVTSNSAMMEVQNHLRILAL